jgi:hypothetical protein
MPFRTHTWVYVFIQGWTYFTRENVTAGNDFLMKNVAAILYWGKDANAIDWRLGESKIIPDGISRTYEEQSGAKKPHKAQRGTVMVP